MDEESGKFFTNFSLELPIKVLLIKKLCTSIEDKIILLKIISKEYGLDINFSSGN